jgi:hypothetical protein
MKTNIDWYLHNSTICIWLNIGLLELEFDLLTEFGLLELGFDLFSQNTICTIYNQHSLLISLKNIKMNINVVIHTLSIMFHNI